MKKVITKKVVFSIYSLVLLSLGAFIQSNCGSATAQGTTAASEVTFDNTGTGLSATNLQDAIAELESSYGPLNIQDALIGTWTGEQVAALETVGTLSLTFNVDGSASCTALAGSIQDLCGQLTGYRLHGRSLLDTSSGDTGNRAIWHISFTSSTSMAMFTDNGRTLWVLSKSS